MFLVYHGFAGLLKQQSAQAAIGVVGGLKLSE